MEWINENLQILATLGSALFVYIAMKASLRKELIGVQKEIVIIYDQIKEIKEDIKEIKRDIKSIDQRLTRLEARFDERGQWEARRHTYTGTEDK